MIETLLVQISIWQNSQTGSPSVQLGAITIDLGKDTTPFQDTLFQKVMNHPDANAAGAIRAPVTHEIVEAFLAVLREEVVKCGLR